MHHRHRTPLWCRELILLQDLLSRRDNKKSQSLYWWLDCISDHFQVCSSILGFLTCIEKKWNDPTHSLSHTCWELFWSTYPERSIPLGCLSRWARLDPPCRSWQHECHGQGQHQGHLGSLSSHLHFSLHPKACVWLLMFKGQCWLQCNQSSFHSPFRVVFSWGNRSFL